MNIVGVKTRRVHANYFVVIEPVMDSINTMRLSDTYMLW